MLIPYFSSNAGIAALMLDPSIFSPEDYAMEK